MTATTETEVGSVPDRVRAWLDGGVRQLCTDAANHLSGVDMDPDTTDRDDAQRWLLAQLAVVNELTAAVAGHKQRLLRMATTLGVGDDQIGQAWGITEEAARQRRRRATQQP